MSEQRGVTIWLTGLPGAGKTTIAQHLDTELRSRGNKVEVLDGDALRTSLNQGLGYSEADRNTNIMRIAFVANLLTRNGVFAIVAAISPYRVAREDARKLIGDFVEVFVDCPVEVLIQRDVKGMYAKALKGEISNFTGISDTYEPPLRPELSVDTNVESVEESGNAVIEKLEQLGYLSYARDALAR